MKKQISPALGMAMRILLAASAAAALPASHAQESADTAPVKEVLGGASAGGFYQLLGETVAEMVRREYPGSSIAYEPGAQAGQLVRLINGEIKLALQSPFELVYALEGRKPFEKAYTKNDFTILARIVDRQNTMIVARREFAKRHAIQTVADIAERKPPLRTSFFQRGNAFADALIAQGMFGMNGISEDEIKGWGGEVYYVPSSEAARLMIDRKLDVNASAAWHPDSKTLQLARSVELVTLPVAREVIDALAEQYGLETVSIPATAYDFMTEDYYTVAVPGYLVASPQLGEQEAYKIAKALYEHFDYYQKAHPIFRQFEPDMLARSAGYRLHPGAERLYREKGLVQD